MGRDVLLSFCIPTYNRSGHLRNTLEHLTALPSVVLSRDVEVVVSDNASEDDTQDVVLEFQKRYPDVIRYFRNAENLKDRNFECALRRGHGEYLHLLNDTVYPTEEGVQRMLEVIRRHRLDHVPLYFKNDSRDNSESMHKTLDAFLDDVSFYITWIGEFGIWRDTLTKLDGFCRVWKLMLVQADVWLRIVAEAGKVVVVRGDFLVTVSRFKKITYVFPKVFGRSYLGIVKPYLRSGHLSRDGFAREKRRLMFQHLIPAYIYVSRHTIMPRRGFVRYLVADYWREWYYWLWALPLFVSSSCAYYVLRPFWGRIENQS